MNTTKIHTRFLLLLSACLITSFVFAQGDKANRPSPPATAKGKIKETIGKATDNPKLQGEGKGEKWAGKAQDTYGKEKDAVQDATEKAADKAQEAADKVKESVQDK